MNNNDFTPQNGTPQGTENEQNTTATPEPDMMKNHRPNPDMHPGGNVCPRCGVQLKEGAAFCGNCGLSLQKADGANPVENGGFHPGYHQEQPNTSPWSRPAMPTDVLSVGDYILMMVLFSLPLVGLVLMLYWSFSSAVGPNRKHFARAYLIFYCISLVFSMIMMGIMGSVVSTFVMEEGVGSLF